MPRINEYAPQTRVQGPTEGRQATAAAFGGGTGQGLSSLGQGINQGAEFIHKRIEASEVSDVSARLAEKQNEYTKRFQEELKNPKNLNNPTFAEDFIQGFDDDVRQLGDGLGTNGARDHFNNSFSRLKVSFFQTALSGQSEMAGAKAKLDATTTLNATGSALRSDPSGLADGLLNWGTVIDSNPSLTAAEKIALKQHGVESLTKDAWRGTISNNPYNALKALQDNEADVNISGEAKDQLIGEAEREIRGREAEEDRRYARAERKRHEDIRLVNSKFSIALQDGDLTVDMVKAQSKILEGTGQGSTDWWFGQIKANAMGGNPLPPSQEYALMERMTLPEGDGERIVGHTQLLSALSEEGYQDPAAFKRLNAYLDDTPLGKRRAIGKTNILKIAHFELAMKGGMIEDVEGLREYDDFNRNLEIALNAEFDAGRDGLELLDQTSKRWFGNSMRRKSPEERINSYINYNLGVQAPEESPWRKNPDFVPAPPPKQDALPLGIPEAPRGGSRVQAPKEPHYPGKRIDDINRPFKKAKESFDKAREAVKKKNIKPWPSSNDLIVDLMRGK